VIVFSPDEFRSVVDEHPLEAFAFDAAELDLARAAMEESGLLLVGEPHGARETPSVLWTLASVLDTRALAFEWSYDELGGFVREFIRSGSFDFDELWQLPESAELFSGDGRFTAGHFALLQRLHDEGRLDQVILFDRLDPGPDPEDWRVRDRDMAERLLEQWDGRARLLVLVGGGHARLDAGATMAAHISRKLPLRPAMIDYASGRCWSRGLHDIAGSLPAAPIRFCVPESTPAVVPGKTVSRPQKP